MAVPRWCDVNTKSKFYFRGQQRKKSAIYFNSKMSMFMLLDL